jgi:hypothetical protein
MVFCGEPTSSFIAEQLYWEDIDEDISIENLLAGKPSGESQTSLKKWLQSRISQ